MKLFSILVAGFALVHGQTDDQIDPRGKERVFLENIIFLHKYTGLLKIGTRMCIAFR